MGATMLEKLAKSHGESDAHEHHHIAWDDSEIVSNIEILT